MRLTRPYSPVLGANALLAVMPHAIPLRPLNELAGDAFHLVPGRRGLLRHPAKFEQNGLKYGRLAAQNYNHPSDTFSRTQRRNAQSWCVNAPTFARLHGGLQRIVWGGLVNFIDLIVWSGRWLCKKQTDDASHGDQ